MVSSEILSDTIFNFNFKPEKDTQVEFVRLWPLTTHQMGHKVTKGGLKAI